MPSLVLPEKHYANPLKGVSIYVRIFLNSIILTAMIKIGYEALFHALASCLAPIN